MARINLRKRAQRQRRLMPPRSKCPACGASMRIHYGNHRTLVMLDGAVRLMLKIRRCEEASWAWFRQPYRSKAEGALALPRHEFGLFTGGKLHAAGGSAGKRHLRRSHRLPESPPRCFMAAAQAADDAC